MKTREPILLVEDDAVDVMIVRRALKDAGVGNPLITAGNGEDALEYLKNCGYEMPCIILLDLNMPKMNGIEFLRIAKQDAYLKTIPVIVLTTSYIEQEKIESFNLGVAGYMIKPVDYRQFAEMMKIIDAYWTVSELP